MSAAIYCVDAFTSRPFAGNPAAVCPRPGPPDEAWMRHVAREMNLSETAFVWPEAGGWRLRWLTPTVEVALCGHATLATAHVLWEQGLAAEARLGFHTRSGLLTAEREGAGIRLDFPAKALHPVEAPAGLLDALGVDGAHVWSDGTDLFVDLADAAQVRGLSPDHRRLRGLGVRGVAVMAPGGAEGVDFVSRFFAPGSGIDEDPVTGSTHCALGPLWAGRLGRQEVVGRQVSARSGEVRVRLHTAADGRARVYLWGQAVTVLRGELLV